MTAGNVDVAYRLESGYNESDDTATWKQAARGTQVTELSLDNALEPYRDSNNPIPVDQLEGNLEGALSISGQLTGDPLPPWAEDFVFHDGGALPTSGGRAPSAEWAIGLDYIGGQIERIVQGAAVTEVSLDWENGTAWSFELTILYATETPSETFTPADLQTLGTGKVYNHAATTLGVDGTSIEGLSSISLSLSNLARLRDGNGRIPYQAVVGAIEPSLEMQSDITSESVSNLEYAYGSLDTDGPSENIGKVPLTIDATNKDGGTMTTSIGAAKPGSHSWDSLTEHDSEEQENITWNILDDGSGAVQIA